VEKKKLSGSVAVEYSLVSADPVPATPGAESTVMMLDGNRNGRYVLFDHLKHEKRYEAEGGCALCHHMNRPYDTATGCYSCHSDMYLSVDIFNHELHMIKNGGNSNCNVCHLDDRTLKIRGNTKDCRACHKSMVTSGSLVAANDGDFQSKAAGYMQAMHGLCIKCHEDVQKSLDPPDENFSRCANCHRALPELTSETWQRRL
jgi:hypothetical protein